MCTTRSHGGRKGTELSGGSAVPVKKRCPGRLGSRKQGSEDPIEQNSETENENLFGESRRDRTQARRV